MVAMRINGTFNYALAQGPQRDPETGFFTGSAAPDFVAGCECQIEKSIPARQMVGEDGQIFSYTYDVFIPRHFKGELAIGTVIQVIPDGGAVDEFSVLGVDDCNRKYIEVWG